MKLVSFSSRDDRDERSSPSSDNKKRSKGTPWFKRLKNGEKKPWKTSVLDDASTESDNASAVNRTPLSDEESNVVYKHELESLAEDPADFSDPDNRSD